MKIGYFKDMFIPEVAEQIVMVVKLEPIELAKLVELLGAD